MTTDKVAAGPAKVSRSADVRAPAHTLFEMVADPHRHSELDGSGSVRDEVQGPHELAKGDTFKVSMKMFGLPYKITSRVVAFDQDRVIEWRHPAGHRWRWEFLPVDDNSTRVTETFDYSRSGVAGKVVLRLLGFPGRNDSGISRTLENLQHRFA